MKRSLLFLFTFLIGVSGKSQKITGQWKGFFIDKSSSRPNWGGDQCEYVLDIESNGNKISGYSYTYFTDNGKRFYTICKLSGTINPQKKLVEIREIERTKTNVPENISNCFQIHRLKYSNDKEGEVLAGDWIPLPNQKGDCGFGATQLSRRKLSSVFPGFNRGVAKNVPAAKKKDPSKYGNAIATAKTNALARNSKSEITASKLIIPETVNASAIITEIKKQDISDEKSIPPPPEFQKRNLNLLKTIEVNNETIKVDLYDNGEIDGDSISLVYNNKVILSNKRLSDKPISVKLNIDTDTDVNELVMFAENLGTIPPNTALMIVTDGNARYEVRITSDLQKSGVIRFVHKIK